MAMRIPSTPRIQYACCAEAPHSKGCTSGVQPGSRVEATGVASMAMRMSSTAAIQSACCAEAPHSKGCTSGVQIGYGERGGTGVALMAMRIPSTAAINTLQAATAEQATAPGQQRFLFHCSVGCTSGVQPGSRVEATGVALMAMRMSSTAAIQYACCAEAPHSKGCTSGVQIESRQRADTGVASMAMRMSSTAAIQYACCAEAHHQEAS